MGENNQKCQKRELQFCIGCQALLSCYGDKEQLKEVED